jgi:hypothetical protein
VAHHITEEIEKNEREMFTKYLNLSISFGKDETGKTFLNEILAETKKM